MAERAAVERSRETRPGLISRLLSALAQCLQWLLMSLVFSVLTEWVGMTFWWPHEGLAHSERMLEAEVTYLQTDVQRSLISTDPAGFALQLVARTHTVLFEWTRISDLMRWLSEPVDPQQHRLRARLSVIYHLSSDYLIAAIQVTQVFALRLAVLLLASPVFVLFALVAIVDGLVKRDLRRWGGGRESSFIYHWAKGAALPLLILCWVVYLALPFSLHPSMVVLPFATLFALSLTVMVASFKKYL